MGAITRYLTAGALALAVAAGGWGWVQHQRAVALAVRLDAARAEIARLRAEAKMREVISNAVDTIERLPDGAVTDWLRQRAGRD